MNPAAKSSVPGRPPPGPAQSEIVSQSEIERLLAQVESVDPSTLAAGAPASNRAAGPEFLGRHEFPKVSHFSPSELRRLRVRHEDFIGSLAARLSIHLGTDVAMKMSQLDAVPFQKFADSLSNPTYLTLLKLQPLPGICLLDIPPRLGLCIVDRELGGPGWAPEETRQIGRIEASLLSRAVVMIVNEWCNIWGDLLEVRPTVLGNETNSRFLTTSAPETSMLVVGVEARITKTVEQMQFAFPHLMLEPLTLRLGGGGGGGETTEKAAKGGSAKWNALFDDVPIQVTAELPEVELSAAQLAGLKPGDVLPLPAELMSRVRLRLADRPGFVGVLGVSNQCRAVRITPALKG